MQNLVGIDVFIWRKLVLCFNAIRIPKKAALVLIPYLPSSLWPILLSIILVGCAQVLHFS